MKPGKRCRSAGGSLQLMAGRWERGTDATDEPRLHVAHTDDGHLNVARHQHRHVGDRARDRTDHLKQV